MSELATINFDAIPAELRQRPHWVCWRHTDGTKLPVNAKSRRLASSTDRSTWATHDESIATYTAGGVDGIGYVFAEDDGMVGIDLDDCIVDGRITPEARSIIDELASYAEVSPSGGGVKLWIKGEKPANARCTAKQSAGMSQIEVYDRGRYFTVTGQRVEGTPATIEARQGQLEALCQRLWPASESANAYTPSRRPWDRATGVAASNADHPGVVTQNATPTRRVNTTEDDVTRRASAYLSTMQPAIQGAAGHNALYAAATAMCHGFGLDRPTAYHLLATEFNPRCVPPWDLSSIRESRDFERKIDEAIRQRHDRPHGWLADAAGYATDDSAVEHGAEVASALLARFNSAKATAEKMAAVDDTPAVSVIEAAGEDGDGATAGLPAWILSPPGLVGELCSWINATAFKPQPILALANAIAFWGAVVGRKVRDEWDLRTNVYTLGVAESGAGKDHSRKCIKRLAAAAGGLAAGLLAGEDVASDSGLLQSVFNNPATLFQLDEIGHFIAQANDRNAQAYTKRIPVTLTKLYSSASSMFRGKEYKTDDRIDIVQPNVCIYGTTNPATFFEGITTTQVRDGFLGRLLVFQTDNNDPDPIAAKPTDPPAGMVVCVLKWLERYIEAPAGVVGNLATREFPWQITVKTEPQAEAIFIDLRADARRRRRKIIGDRSGLDALWSRAEENARKVALVIASSCAYDAPIIGADLANYAATLVSVLTDQLVDAIRHNVADTDTGRIKNKILAVVRSRRGGVTSTDISRSLKHERPRDRREALADLVEAGELVIETINTVGRPATRYRIG